MATSLVDAVSIPPLPRAERPQVLRTAARVAEAREWLRRAQADGQSSVRVEIVEGMRAHTVRRDYRRAAKDLGLHIRIHTLERRARRTARGRDYLEPSAVAIVIHDA